MSDESRPTSLLAHARYRMDPVASRLRETLAAVPLVERVAWHAGEAVHMRQPTATHSPPAADLTGLYDDQMVPPARAAGEGPPGRLQPAGELNPVLTAADVTDFGRTDCVADPFLFVDADGHWHMFFEVYTQNREPSAVIAHAESTDGYDWTYDQVVLETDEHLSYPYVFRWNGTHYMIPDRWAKAHGPAGVTLYRADPFPHEWVPVADLHQPTTPVHDFSPFRWNDRWWALVGDGQDLFAYYSDTLEAPDWTAHDQNPVAENRPTAARPGGRPLVFDDHVLAFYQDCARRYGECVRAFEITTLSPTAYEDRERPDSPVLEPTGGLGWNSGAMHQLDPWFDGSGYHCAVDGTFGLGYRLLGEHHWAIGIYRAPVADATSPSRNPSP
jgi:hypothetical protein